MNDNDDNDNDDNNNKHFLLQEEEFRLRNRDDLKMFGWSVEAIFTQKLIALAPAQKSYRIEFLFTYQTVISTRFL